MTRLAAMLLLAACPALAASVTVPIGGGKDGIDALSLASVPGIAARDTTAISVDGEKPARRLTFTKRSAERRLLAFEATLAQKPIDVKALSVRCRLRMIEGKAQRLALVAFENDGGAWFRVGVLPIDAKDFVELRLPLASLKRAAFAQDKDEAVNWSQVERLWLGVTLDGASEGTFEISHAVLTNEPYRPTQPLRVTHGSPGTWSVTQDAAATAKITTPAEGPGDKPCMRVDFRFPGGRHMYVVPRVPLQEIELEGFKALRFTYKATLPKGIDGLLVMLLERDGTQYLADPAPPAAGEWKTVTIPFASFTHGTWSPDENNRLDLNDVGAVAVGIHGTATEAQAKGTIWVSDVQFVP